jgi:hypothetical protein
VGGEAPHYLKKGCGGDSPRRNKIAEKKVLGQLYYTLLISHYSLLIAKNY